MIHPSYRELLEKVNRDAENEEEPLVTSRYSIVLATSKRARQLIAGAEPMVPNAAGKKALSVAVSELYDGAVNILPAEEETEEEEIAETATMEAESAAVEE